MLRAWVADFAVDVGGAALSETGIDAVGKTVGGTGSMPRAHLRHRRRHRQEGEVLLGMDGLNSLAVVVVVAEGLGRTLPRWTAGGRDGSGSAFWCSLREGGEEAKDCFGRGRFCCCC